MKALKFATMLNLGVVAALAGLGVATVLGGGRADPFPADERLELVPTPSEGSGAAAPSDVARAPRLDVPPEWRRVEPIAPRWEETPDGRVRFLD